MDEERRKRVEQRAFEIWVREGHPAGREAEHWYHAEAEVAREEAERAKREADQALNVAAQALQTAVRAKKSAATGGGGVAAAKTEAGDNAVAGDNAAAKTETKKPKKPRGKSKE
jgi:predicted RNA-binding Zn ribbon-like protein